MIRKILCYVVLCFTIAACAGLKLDNTPGVAALTAAEDTLLNAATLTLCRAVSIGAWQRAYADTPAKASAWKTLCDQSTVAPAPSVSSGNTSGVTKPPAPITPLQ